MGRYINEATVVKRAVEVCLGEELGEAEKEGGEGGLGETTFHGDEVLGERTWALRRYTGPE